MSPLPAMLVAITVKEEKPMDGMRLGQEKSSLLEQPKDGENRVSGAPVHLHIHATVHLIHLSIGPAI